MLNKSQAVRLIVLLVGIYWVCPGSRALGEPAFKQIIVKGETLPELTLDAPDSAENRAYLGIEGREPFSLYQVSARIIILEIFSYLCTHCRRQALVLNDVYERIQNDKTVTKGVKIIGIAAACDQKQVDKWKDTFDAPFPLIPDPKQKSYTKLGRPPVPCTLFVDAEGTILAVYFGAAEDTDAFYQKLLDAYKETTNGSDKKDYGCN